MDDLTRAAAVGAAKKVALDAAEADYRATVAAQLAAIRAGYTQDERDTVAAYEGLMYG